MIGQETNTVTLFFFCNLLYCRRYEPAILIYLILHDPLEEEMATYFSILAWRIPWTEEPGRQAIVHRVPESDTTEVTEHARIYKHI